MKKLFILVIALSSVALYGQNWKVTSEDTMDGKVTTAVVEAKTPITTGAHSGKKFNPKLTIKSFPNGNFRVNLEGIGGFKSRLYPVIWALDSEPNNKYKVYNYHIDNTANPTFETMRNGTKVETTIYENTVLTVFEFYYPNSKAALIHPVEMFDKIAGASKLYVRVQTNEGNRDYSFNFNNGSEAMNKLFSPAVRKDVIKKNEAARAPALAKENAKTNVENEVYPRLVKTIETTDFGNTLANNRFKRQLKRFKNKIIASSHISYSTGYKSNFENNSIVDVYVVSGDQKYWLGNMEVSKESGVYKKVLADLKEGKTTKKSTNKAQKKDPVKNLKNKFKLLKNKLKKKKKN